MSKFSLSFLVVFAVSAAVPHIQAAPIVIDPVSATDNGHYSPTPGASATMTINGSGLSNAALVATGQPIPGSYPTVTADPSSTSFFSNYAILTLGDDPSGPAIPTINYTLVSSPTDPGYDISAGHFWQYSGDRESSGDRSLTSASILVSSDGVTFTPAGTLLPGYVEGPYPGPTPPNGPAVPDAGVDFSLTGTFTHVRYIELTNLTAAGDHDIRVAFNEIRFTGTVSTPEPGTLTLASIGLLALGWLGYRRRHSA